MASKSSASLDDALAACRKPRATRKRSSSAARRFIDCALPQADRLYLTLVLADVDGDTKFPAVDWETWDSHRVRSRTMPTPRTSIRLVLHLRTLYERNAVALSAMAEHGEETVERCDWGTRGGELMTAYHDEEWGVPVHDDRKQFEFLTLESAQAGLSWLDRAAQARGLSQGVRRFRSGESRPLHRQEDREAARRSRHHPQSAEGRGRGHQRPRVSRGAGRVRHVRQVHLGLRRRPTDPEPLDAHEADCPPRRRNPTP